MTEEELLDQLGDALNELRHSTCSDMVPLWLNASRRVRGRLTGGERGNMGFDPSPRYLRLSAGNQSNYRALASWRQVVIWRNLLASMGGEVARRKDNEARAVRRMYFAPFPSNIPPYAYSRKAPDEALVDELGGPSQFKECACRGAAALLLQVEEEAENAPYRGPVDTAVTDLIRLGAKKSLWNTLKAERFRPRESKETS